ncbi:MAG TPA: formylglycine-generating enzyme family protein [Planctomycetota bacterium]|nr:formylglycine-generating enzyme family protein [Planctomycetota bacterium]
MKSCAAMLLLFLAPALLSCSETQEPTATSPNATIAGHLELMVHIPGGSFVMGSDASDEVDEPPHKVFVGPFYIDTHEVTQEAYERLMGKNPSLWKDPKNPVEQIRWSQAAAYCNARSRRDGLAPAYDEQSWACDFTASGYRLPTEAEWEFACRAGTTTTYFFGNDRAKLGDYAWFRDNCMRTPQAVGQKRINPWGLHDLYGNVWEWCHDFYAEDYYRKSPERDPRGPAKGNTRVIRGGAWSSKASQCRSSYRDQEYPQFTDVCFAADRNGLIGFRCVRPARGAASGD